MFKELTTLALFVSSAAAFSAPVLVNGSFNTDLPQSSWNMNVPAPWFSTNESPDINDVGFVVGMDNALTGYGTVVTASRSPDGGTFVGFGRDGGYYEAIGQNISGFEAGKTYRLSWYLANFGLASQGSPIYVGDVGISVYVDGVLVGSGADRSLQEGWIRQSISFTATATDHLIEFRDNYWDQPTGGSHTLIDGVSLQESTPLDAAPVPANPAWAIGLLSALLSGAGLLAARRRISITRAAGSPKA